MRTRRCVVASVAPDRIDLAAASETPQPRLSTWPWGWLTRAAEAWRQVGRSALTSDWQRCSLPFSYWKSSLSTLVDRFCLLLWWPWEIHSLLRLVSYDLLPGIACALSRKTFGGLRDLRALASGVDSNVSANESGGAGCWRSISVVALLVLDFSDSHHPGCSESVCSERSIRWPKTRGRLSSEVECWRRSQRPSSLFRWPFSVRIVLGSRAVVILGGQDFGAHGVERNHRFLETGSKSADDHLPMVKRSARLPLRVYRPELPNLAGVSLADQTANEYETGIANSITRWGCLRARI